MAGSVAGPTAPQAVSPLGRCFLVAEYVHNALVGEAARCTQKSIVGSGLAQHTCMQHMQLRGRPSGPALTHLYVRGG